jgi:hypothetical protein
LITISRVIAKGSERPSYAHETPISPSFIRQDKEKTRQRSYLPPPGHAPASTPQVSDRATKMFELVFWRTHVVIFPPQIFNRASRISQNRSIILIMRLPGIRRSVGEQSPPIRFFGLEQRGQRVESYLISRMRNPTFQAAGKCCSDHNPT